VARKLMLVAAIPLMFSAVGCKKKAPPPPEPPPLPPPVERSIQVTQILPATVEPNRAIPSGKVFGTMFQQGATVNFVGPQGNVPADKVTMLDANTLLVAMPGLSGGSYDVTVANPDGQSSTLRGGLTVRSAELPCKFTVVYFDLDKSKLRADGISTMTNALSCIQGATGQVRIEGHCDERGTTDYNLALGQRRADSVKSFLTKAGVSASRISTVSIGEERPADPGHDENAWARNRRSETTASP
jgi:peptidoglycan-associated lipoprotein